LDMRLKSLQTTPISGADRKCVNHVTFECICVR